MSSMNRRSFMKRAALSAAGLGLASCFPCPGYSREL
ncbi:MAG: twin-arginine translocation signal domain-containing protein, partial [Thermoguttaceae bacterium]|nr:twin-arginine translocation signal domain-containing protein [Thermoguttaceae bacterium]